MGDQAEEEKWLYLDAATGQQKGPVGVEIAKRLLRKGLLRPEQLVWTPRLQEWAAVSSVEPFAGYWQVWTASWFYLPDAAASERRGPVTTQELVALFVDGEVDGMTLVWRQDMSEWQPIGQMPALKEFLQEANSELDREAELTEQMQQVAPGDQVFHDTKVEAFVAEDGKHYVFDAEGKKWVTPEDKIEEDLEALREAAGGLDDEAEKQPEDGNGKAAANGKKAGDGKEEARKKPVDAKTSEATASDASAPSDATKKKRKKKKKNDKWQKRKSNTWVYVNGLPLDVTVQEVADHFSKCGVIQQDVTTGEPRVKLYKNKELGGLNGDGSVCFMKEASVELAVQLLDKSQIRPDWPIDVSPAVFTQKGSEYVKRKKPRIDARAKVKLIEQQKALSWNEGEDGDRAGLRIVVIKRMFTPEEITDTEYEQELEADIEEECAKIGELTKITLFSKHPDGVVVIKFASSGSAAKCVDVMNGRFFAGRKLECGFWDGADYTHRESQVEQNERSEKFREWLEEGGSSSESEDDSGKEGTIPAPSGAVHAGRELPAMDDSNDDSDESDTEEDPPAAEAVHAGRVMPDLDDDDGDDDD